MRPPTAIVNLISVFLFLLEMTPQTQTLSAECGHLKLEQLYNQKHLTDFEEFPWIGRIAYKDASTNGSIRYKCLAVLISDRDLITTSHCFENAQQFQPFAVILGDWSTSNDVGERDCNEQMQCAAPPQEYEIEEIALHPDYNSTTRANDIAIMRLRAAVIYSDFIKPICMPAVAAAASMNNNDFVAQHLNYVGFPVHGLMKKLKGFTHVLSPEYCHQIMRFKLAYDQICGSCDPSFAFLPGSAVMGVSVRSAEPQRFYLIGVLASDSSLGNCAIGQPQVFVSVIPHLEWIRYNMA